MCLTGPAHFALQDSAVPAEQRGSVQAMNQRHSGDNTTSGDDTVTSPLACGEGSNSAGEGHTMASRRPHPKGGSGSSTPDDNASTTTRKRRQQGAAGVAFLPAGLPPEAGRPLATMGAQRQGSGEKAGGAGGSNEGSGQPSSSLDSTPSGEEDDKSSHDNEENQRDGKQPAAAPTSPSPLGAAAGAQQRCRSSQAGPSLEQT